MVQHSPCCNTAGERRSSVEEAPSIIWFSPCNGTTPVLSKAPLITPWFLPPTTHTKKLFQKQTAPRTTNLLSSQNLAQSPQWHRHQVQGAWGALQGRQVGSPNEPTVCSPQPANHGAATAGHLMTMWKWPYRLWGQRDKQQGHTKITWAAKDANKLVFCTKKPSVFSSPCLCPEPYCWPWSI